MSFKCLNFEYCLEFRYSDLEILFMSINADGVKINKRNKNYWLILVLAFTELFFSVLLVVSLASNLLFPQRVSAVAGVSAKLSYQGRLTDLSGNPLGGTGTNYCFRFSIYDAAAAGTKVWPAGAPSSTTVKVEDGVFNTDIGSADSLASFDFSSNDSLYLNVEINATPTTCGGAWEQLDLRQRIDAVSYARAAEGVYSSLLRAPTGGTAVQIGTGAGAATPIFLNLDVKNTQEGVGDSCATNGQIWYNSADSRARVCQGSVIRDMIDGILVRDEGADQGRASTALDFTGGGVSASKGAGGVINVNIPFQGVAISGGGTISSGLIVFSNSPTVTFGLAGSTVTASAAGGGGGATYSSTVLGKKHGWQSTVTSLGQNTVYIFPDIVNANIVASVIKMPVSIIASTNSSASRQVGWTADFGVYTRHATNSTVLTRHYSTSYTLAVSWNSNTSMALSMITAIGNSTSYNTTASTSTNGVALSSLIHSNREFIMPWNTTLAPGEYWFAVRNSSSSVGGAIASALSISYVGGASLTNAAIGVATSAISGNNIARNIGLGNYSATTTALPPSINMTQIARGISNPFPVIYMLSVTQ